MYCIIYSIHSIIIYSNTIPLVLYGFPRGIPHTHRMYVCMIYIYYVSYVMY